MDLPDHDLTGTDCTLYSAGSPTLRDAAMITPQWETCSENAFQKHPDLSLRVAFNWFISELSKSTGPSEPFTG
jgi:hypothetical protein